MNQVFVVIGAVVLAAVYLICGAILCDSGRKLMQSDNAFKREKGRCDIASTMQCIAIAIIIVVLLIVFGRS